MFDSAAQFPAVLGAELVRAFRAFQRGVGIFPEPLGIEHDAQFPHEPREQGQHHQRDGEKAPYIDQRREHHQMIPVENAAGGAAAGVHHQPEGTPDQHADEVTHIKDHRDYKEQGLGDAPRKAPHITLSCFGDGITSPPSIPKNRWIAKTILKGRRSRTVTDRPAQQREKIQ